MSTMCTEISPLVVAHRYHISNGVPQPGTVVVAACGTSVPFSLNIVLSRYNTGSIEPQAATKVVAACGMPLPINASLMLESKMGTQLVAERQKPLPLQ
jgi:hypothetical protein